MLSAATSVVVVVAGGADVERVVVLLILDGELDIFFDVLQFVECTDDSRLFVNTKKFTVGSFLYEE